MPKVNDYKLSHPTVNLKQTGYSSFSTINLIPVGVMETVSNTVYTQYVFTPPEDAVAVVVQTPVGTAQYVYDEDTQPLASSAIGFRSTIGSPITYMLVPGRPFRVNSSGTHTISLQWLKSI